MKNQKFGMTHVLSILFDSHIAQLSFSLTTVYLLHSNEEKNLRNWLRHVWVLFSKKAIGNS